MLSKYRSHEKLKKKHVKLEDAKSLVIRGKCVKNETSPEQEEFVVMMVFVNL